MLPSVAEIGDDAGTGTWNIDQGTRALSYNWWLRSPTSNTNSAAFVRNNGIVASYGISVDHYFSIYPALKLNLASVLFTSAASGK